ncbi:nucleotidyltransferase family protein [Tenacibaculum xiamenense]|uniref:nucleotidyltransferase family protein n=1 Tax=Tenacibaculum xiamenense TaxID=1261553 RepID=UPI0038951FA9
MLEVLRTVRTLNLNDCWIGAGFVRNKIWDVKHNKLRTKLNDIDVIYFDEIKCSKEEDLQLEYKLVKVNPSLKWSVKNQARMHIKNGHHQYNDCYEAISFWPETATSVAVRLNDNDEIECIAPYDLDDLFNLVVKPTPEFNVDVYNARIKKKKWLEKWNKLNIKIATKYE